MYDSPLAWSVNMQDWCTRVMYEIEGFHDEIIVLMTFIVILIGTVMYTSLKRKGLVLKRWIDGEKLEIIWTILPGIILVYIGIDSFKLLYGLDEVIEVGVTVKAVGHQWYWSYEYGDYKKNINYTSYMKEEIDEGEDRLLSVDNKVILPIDTKIRIIVTASDVIHSWAIPSMGIKIDGIPGRINQGGIEIKRPGEYYGQCSELCGYGHGFMPIGVKGTLITDYINWVKSQ